jgi:hypothetical protein
MYSTFVLLKRKMSGKRLTGRQNKAKRIWLALKKTDGEKEKSAQCPGKASATALIGVSSGVVGLLGLGWKGSLLFFGEKLLEGVKLLNLLLLFLLVRRLGREGVPGRLVEERRRGGAEKRNGRSGNVGADAGGGAGGGAGSELGGGDEVYEEVEEIGVADGGGDVAALEGAALVLLRVDPGAQGELRRARRGKKGS